MFGGYQTHWLRDSGGWASEYSLWLFEKFSSRYPEGSGSLVVRSFLVVFSLLHSTTVQYVRVPVFGYLPLGERSSSAGPRGTLVGISSSWLKQTRTLSACRIRN